MPRGLKRCPPARCRSDSARCARGNSPASGNMCRASSLNLLRSRPIAKAGTNSGGLMSEKGPPVFLDYDQAELDAAYNQAAYAPNREQLIKRRIRDSELAHLRVGEPERLAYGPTGIEQVAFYTAVC